MSVITDHPKNAGQPWLQRDGYQKPYRGKIVYGATAEYPDGYIILGQFVNHPRFAGNYGHTSLIVWEQPHHPGEDYDVETLNSRYRIISRAIEQESNPV